MYRENTRGPGTLWCAWPGLSYLPARRCQRVAFNIFLCFFLRMRLRRFFINEPMAGCNLAGRRGK